MLSSKIWKNKNRNIIRPNKTERIRYLINIEKRQSLIARNILTLCKLIFRLLIFYWKIYPRLRKQKSKPRLRNNFDFILIKNISGKRQKNFIIRFKRKNLILSLIFGQSLLLIKIYVIIRTNIQNKNQWSQKGGI